MTTRCLLSGVLVFFLSTFLTGTTFAQEQDKTAATLSRSIETYESTMNALREDVTKALQRELDAAKTANDIEKAIQQARDAQRAFESQGKLPGLPGKQQWETRYANAAQQMQAAYATAIAAYNTQQMPKLANAIESDMKQFGTLWDLVPWQETLSIPSSKDPSLSLTSKSPPLKINSSVVGEFRMEIKASRTGSAGKLLIELPTADGKSVELPAVANSTDKVRVLLTVSKSHASVDLGTTLPAETTVATSADAVTIRASQGDFSVESIRVKPIVMGAPPKVPEVAKQPARTVKPKEIKPEPQDATGLMPKGSKWRGEVAPKTGNAFHVVMKITKCDADEIIMQGDWPGSGGMELTFAVRGTELSLTAARPTGGKGGIFDDADGSGSVKGDIMTTSYSWRKDFRKTKGQPVSGTMTFRKEN